MCSRADVLDHADARDRVELLAGEVAVVHHPDLDPVADAGRLGPLARDPRLRLRQGDADDLDAVAGGGVGREAAPAAADVEDPLAGLERQLRADHLELRLLRLLERRRAPREDRAAVGHRLVEEEREELGRQVVVVADRAGVALLRPARALRPQLGARAGRGGG